MLRGWPSHLHDIEAGSLFVDAETAQPPVVAAGHVWTHASCRKVTSTDLGFRLSRNRVRSLANVLRTGLAYAPRIRGIPSATDNQQDCGVHGNDCGPRADPGLAAVPMPSQSANKPSAVSPFLNPHHCLCCQNLTWTDPLVHPVRTSIAHSTDLTADSDPESRPYP